MVYRPELDGLRAIAITAVVAYHLRVPGVTGGFVGVDVFFVLSGYVITAMLLERARDRGAIPILEFYAGRARRLLPAYALVLIVTGALGAYLLPANGELQAFADSIAASLAFVSNIYFWRTVLGYFVEPAEWIPLLHTWTLSVEAQFYLLWPLALAVLLRGRGRWLIAGIALACAASLALATWAAAIRPVAGFFWMPTRLWELAAGGLLAAASFHRRPGRPDGEPSLAWPVLLALLVSPWILRSDSQFPLLAIAVPVAMTTYLIWALSAAQPGPAGRLLRSAPMVYLGRISYSWYLWHWPLLALARVTRLGRDDFRIDLAVVAGSLCLAALTFRYVENPIRRAPPAWLRRSGIALSASAVSLLAVFVLAAALQRHAAEVASSDPRLGRLHEAKARKFPQPPGCVDVPLLPFVTHRAWERCVIGDTAAAARVLLWGDSHALHYMPLLDRIGKDNGFGVVGRTMGGCRPILGERVQPALQERCDRFKESVVEEIAQGRERGVFAVILAGKWLLAPREWLEEGQDPRAAWEAGFRRTIERLDSSGVNVLVLGRVPTFPFAVPECLARRSAVECAIRRSAHEARFAQIHEAIHSAAEGKPRIVYWVPTPILCPGHLCLPVAGDVVLYSDDNHLSWQGAMWLRPHLEPVVMGLASGWLPRAEK